MGWNVELPPGEWYAPNPPAETSRWTYEGAWSFPIERVIREAMDQDVIAIDTETTGLNLVKDVPLYWSLAWGQGMRSRRMCMPISTLPYFREVLADPRKRWVLANAKYDMHMLANVGQQFAGEVCDVAVMHALLYEENSHALKDMAREVLGWKWTEFKDTFGLSEKKDGAVAEALTKAERFNLPLLVEYASNDAYGTLQIYYKLKEELESEYTWSMYPAEFSTMADIFFKTEMPFTKVLWRMERRGIKVSEQYLQQISGPCLTRIDEVGREINRVAGKMVNPKSTVQLRNLFFNDLRLRPLGYTKGGKKGVKEPSVDSAFLEHYAKDVPICRLILEHRELEKLNGTYIVGLREAQDQYGRIHTRFNQDVARTGRLSSANPNLQNIPTPEHDRFKIRGAFIPKPGHKLIVVDYSALEMRLLAAAAQDPLMTKIFLDGKDIHMGNAEMVFGRKVGMTYDEIVQAKKVDGKIKKGELPPEALTERMAMALDFRGKVKAVAFGLNYGMKEKKLAHDLGCSVDEALALMDEYMATYPTVQKFYADVIERTRAKGYSFTLLGRRRYHPGIASPREADRWQDERKAVNNEIQGTAADVVRCAMLMCDAADLDYHFGCDMLLQVHDELVFECPDETVEEARPRIKDLMEHPLFTDLNVPLEVSMGVGESWMHAK